MGSELSRNQRRALGALLEHPTAKDAAAACELTPRTVYGYLADPAFKAALRKRQAAIVAGTVAAMIGGRGEALATLQAALTDPEASWSERIRAAHYWLSHSQDAIELDALIERIERVEELLGGMHGN